MKWCIPLAIGLVILWIVLPVSVEYYKERRERKKNGGKNE